MEQNKSVGIWIRVSTEDQAKGESPEHHEKRARLYAEAKGWTVAAVYHLEALSGKSVMGYSQTKAMLDDVRSKKITGLIFSKLARLARNTKELLEFADIFKFENADLISLQEAIDTSTPAGRLFYTMIAAMAQWEREEISSRVAASVPIRAQLGKRLGGQAPFGYMWEGNELLIHPDEGPIRKLMYELFIEHRRKGTVAKILNDRGYRTRTGNKFSDSGIKHLLRDPIAKGIRRSNFTKSPGVNKWPVLKPESDWVLVPCPALIDEPTWNQVHQILKDQEDTRKKPAKKGTHLFTGIVCCAACGHRMYVPSKSEKYICLACHKTRIPTADLEEIYFENLKAFLVTNEDLQGFFENADLQILQKEKQIESIQKEIKSCNDQLEKMVSLHLAGEMPAEGFGKHYKPVFERVTQLQTTLPELQAEVDFLRMETLNSDEVISEAKSLYDKWPTLDNTAKRSIVEQITESITVDTEDITIKFSYAPLASPNGHSFPKHL